VLIWNNNGRLMLQILTSAQPYGFSYLARGIEDHHSGHWTGPTFNMINDTYTTKQKIAAMATKIT